MASGPLLIESARNWRSLISASNGRRIDELVSGEKYALVLGPTNVGASVANTAILDRALVPVASTLLSAQAFGFPEGTTTLDVFDEDAGPAATALSAPLALNEPTTVGEEAVEVNATDVVPATTAFVAGREITLRAVTGAGESIQHAMAVLIFRVP